MEGEYIGLRLTGEDVSGCVVTRHHLSLHLRLLHADRVGRPTGKLPHSAAATPDARGATRALRQVQSDDRLLVDGARCLDDVHWLLRRHVVAERLGGAVSDERSTRCEMGRGIGGREGGRARHLSLALDDVERLGDLTNRRRRHGGQFEEREAAAVGLVALAGWDLLQVLGGVRGLDCTDEDDALSARRRLVLGKEAGCPHGSDARRIHRTT